MDADKVAFWGIVLKPGEEADLDLDDGETLRVTSASYGEELGDTSGRSVITASIRPDDDSPPRKYAVAVLTAGKTETVTMDVGFIGEENVTFEVTGKNAVHLVGNFTFENDLDDEDSEEDDGESHFIGLYEDTMESESEDDEQEKVKALTDHDRPIITELPNEDENQDDKDEEEQPTKVDRSPVASKKKKGKKGKVPNGDSAGPAKKVADVSAEPLAKAVKQTPGKTTKENVIKGAEDGGKSPTVGSQQKKSAKHKKKKSGKQKDASLDAEQAGGLSNVEKNEKVEGKDKSAKESRGEQSGKGSDSAIDVDAATPAKEAQGGDEGVETVGEGNKGDEVVPSTKKGKKRRRKQNVTLAVSPQEQAPTPPSAKKNKVSERVATPAPPKMSKQVVPSSEASSKPNGQAQANGVSEANEGELKTPSTGAPSSKKRKRGRKRKDA